MNATNLIGTIAGILTSIAAIPQLIKVIKTKSTHDISLLYFVVLLTGVVLWFVYGILIYDWPVILANGFTFFILASILGYKIKYE